MSELRQGEYKPCERCAGWERERAVLEKQAAQFRDLVQRLQARVVELNREALRGNIDRVELRWRRRKTGGQHGND